MLNVNAMRSPNRLFSAETIELNSEISLDAERSHYVSRTLRLKVGDRLNMFDGNGGEFRTVITQSAKGKVHVRAEQRHDYATESPLPVHLLQGISRGDRMDTVIQKTTELGVARISPVLTEFSVVRLDAARAAKRTQHWMRVAQSTCEQCGRNSVPVIDTPVTLTDVFDAAATLPQQRLVLQPESSACISDISLAQHDTVLLIGPEGGFSATENEQALAAGFQPASIGPRILRTETAAIAAIAILQSRCGDL